jgi:hypothetical protein
LESRAFGTNGKLFVILQKTSKNLKGFYEDDGWQKYVEEEIARELKNKNHFKS